MNEEAKAAARRIARQVMKRERSLEAEIIESAELTIDIVRSRGAFRAGVGFNQRPLELLAERQMHLVEARRAGADLHSVFQEMAVATFDEALEAGCQRQCLPTLWRQTRTPIAAT